MKAIATPSAVFLLCATVLSAFAVAEEELSIQQQIDALQAEIAELKAEKTQAEPQAKAKTTEKNTHFVSYGSMVYKHYERFANVQDTRPEQRVKADIERIVTEFSHQPAEHWSIEVEIEYEHGGTGSTMEYDGFEEFGEFETEIEAGGEVVVEKAQIQYQPSALFGARFGRIHIPVGLGTRLHSPARYFTAERHWSEASLIPQVWHETGVGVFGQWQGFNYQALVTTGLNSEFFRTPTWVAGGHQMQFEFVNADALATTVQIGYGDVRADKGIALSYYFGDTSGNRHKEDQLTGKGRLSIWSVHGAWTLGDATVRGQYLAGTLDDSAAIATANKNTAGLRPGVYSQVGSEAESFFVEAGYNLSPLLNLSHKLQVFGVWEAANPLKSVGSSTPSKRFNQTETGIGLNYYPIPALVLKTQFSQWQSAQNNIPDTQSLSLAAGYRFSL